jgi:MFS transporter, DHA2 family, multidrug resistance protein
MLAQRSQFHQVRLAEHVLAASPSYQQVTRQASDYFIAHGASPGEAQRQALGWIGQLVLNQSTLLAYIDVFAATALFALLLIPIALCMRRIDPTSRPAQAG